jgi:hypothetical protein
MNWSYTLCRLDCFLLHPRKSEKATVHLVEMSNVISEPVSKGKGKLAAVATEWQTVKTLACARVEVYLHPFLTSSLG